MSETQAQNSPAAIAANFNNTVDKKEVNFSFRTTKDDATGVEFKRATITIEVPVPSIEGIIAILESGSEAEQSLLLEAAASIVIARAREVINDDDKMTADTFPMDKLTWAAIANRPKAERRSSGISKDQWDDFMNDYIAVMPAVLNKSVEVVTKGAKYLVAKFSPIKTDKKVIAHLNDYLVLYANASPNAEQYLDCIEAISAKATELINTTENSLLATL